jgi:CRP-like cAMP-binding protein
MYGGAMNLYDNFLKNLSTTHVKKGELIFVQDEVPRQAYGIKEGVIKVYNLTANGEEKPIAFKLQGDIFSLGWLFNRVDRSLYFYEACTNCELYVINKTEFHRLLDEEPTIIRPLFNYLLNEHLSNGLSFNALEQSRSLQKIIYALQSLCLRYGEDVAPDVVHIKIPLRQQDIANMLGLTRETTALELKKLKDQGVLTYKRSYYTIKTAKLNALLDDEYNPGISLSPKKLDN